MNDPYTLHKLDNGLQIVIEVMPGVRSAAAGFLARTGGRDEARELAGVSHFLEHMMFKGTAKRGWRDITIDFDKLGSSYNAYTSEERTFYYGWVRKTDITSQIELLADMMRSTLPEEEFDMERKVILEEIAMSKDSLEHVAYDFIMEKVYAGHALAWPVLGYTDTVEPMKRDAMHAYFTERYAPDNLMLIVAGHVDPQEIIGTTEALCGEWRPSGYQGQRTPPDFQSGEDKLQVDRFKQQLIALSYPSVGSRNELTETAETAATILGGENSRLYWNVVQAGISPRAGAFHVQYEDCGLMMLYGACQPEHFDKLSETLQTEADKLCQEKVQPHEVERVKNKRRTSLAVEGEAPYHRLTQIMEDMDCRGRPRTVEELLADIDAVTADRIFEYFEQYPINAGGHVASVGPLEA